MFYDAAAGRARVLGGGFIQSADAKAASRRTAAGGVATPPRLAETIRG